MKIDQKNLFSTKIAKNNLDDPETTNSRRMLLKKNKFLSKIYEEWFQMLFQHIPETDSCVLEIGAGPGFSNNFSKNVILTDILHVNDIDVQCDGTNLPFKNEAFHAVIMINVLHHIQGPARFFSEASRCLRNNGVICMIEPWNTSWSKFIYTYFHFELFDPSYHEWELEKGGPLSKSNQAMPWIILSRDFNKFISHYPEFSIEVFQKLMPLVYILSGGFSYRCLIPAFTYGLWRKLERSFESKQGMFAFIVIRKRSLSNPVAK
ncbi:MAG: class I SAM-dependent methyltransferase [Candidatus Methanofastidiosa archaeon]|nr:class I SAM-dependent methyltransferase [Candidatus Methanofastidiosa archaeon]